MVNIIFILLLVLTLIVETLSGLRRGWKYSLLKLSTVIISGVLAVCLKNVFLGLIENIEIDGQKLPFFLTGLLPDYFESFGELILSFIEFFLSISLYYTLFINFTIITSIIYAIIKHFITPDGDKKYTEKENKNFFDNINSVWAKRLFGSIVGLVIGFTVAIFYGHQLAVL